MKRLLILAVLIFVGVAGWRIGDRLSPDALGMAIGIIFGVMASIPAALLVLAAGRRADAYRGGSRQEPRRQPAQPPVVMIVERPQPPQPPVHVVPSHVQALGERQPAEDGWAFLWELEE